MVTVWALASEWLMISEITAPLPVWMVVLAVMLVVVARDMGSSQLSVLRYPIP